MHKGQFNQNTRFSRHIVMITNYTTMNNRRFVKFGLAITIQLPGGTHYNFRHCIEIGKLKLTSWSNWVRHFSPCRTGRLSNESLVHFQINH